MTCGAITLSLLNRAMTSQAQAQASPNLLNLKTLSGVIERITYQNAENGYTVARLMPDRPGAPTQTGVHRSGENALVTIVGTLTGVAVGEALELSGFWQHHSQHGWQFTVSGFRSVLPATTEGLRKYLGSGLIKGIGPKTADRIVAHFNEATLDVLEAQPERLREVSGIGKHRVAVIKQAWREQKAIKEIMMFLQEHSVSAALAARIYKEYGDAAIMVTKNEPYRLARDVWGIGFRTADKIAQALGYKPDDPERLKAGALYALSEASGDGHTYLPSDKLIEQAAELLGVPEKQAQEAVRSLVAEHGAQMEVLRQNDTGAPAFEPIQRPPKPSSPKPRSVAERADTQYVTRDTQRDANEWKLPLATRESQPVVYLFPFYQAENNAARHVQRLSACPPAQRKLTEFAHVNFDAMFSYLARTDNLSLSQKQKEGVQQALTQPVSVITGGPGTGKTTSMRALIRALTVKGKTVVLAAPTGRAAKRLSEATGIEAKTLHRLLQLRPGGKAFYDADNPIPADMVIVDEMSMIDTLLMNTLLKAVATGTHVLLVGDADQLPSVGAGDVLADIIASGAVPVIKLDHIFRQSSGSAIITNAHRINHGEMPLASGAINDFYIFGEDNAERAASLVVELVSKRIPAKFGIPPADVQVLVPMHGGKCGVAVLNEALQAALNPPGEGKPQKQFGDRIFRLGDKVLQIRNNYDKDVFNGDAGVITSLDLENQTLTARLEDGRPVEYDFTDLDQLVLAYAASIHKSQGSEYPAVVVPLLMSHYMMLERKLIYTAVTRAKRLAVLVGSRKAIAMAVKNAGGQRRVGRYTGLAVRLQSQA